MPQSLAVKRFALLPAVPAAKSADAPMTIRRYKLARLRVDDRTPRERFAHLKRAHD